MDKKTVMVKNTTNGRVGIDLPDLSFRRTWERKGAQKPVDISILEQAIYDPGVEYLFKEGILYIEDMDVKIALGLEAETAKAPENIIVLNDQQKTRYLTVAPVHEFKQLIGKLSYEQIHELAQFAIEKEYTNFDKCEILQKTVGIDVIKAIQLNRQNAEDTKEG